jgi:hypothetical protein
MAKKKLDPKAKAKRQKIIAGVGGVLLLGLLAFQIPKTLKMLNQNQSNPTTTTAKPATPAAGSGAPLAPPTLNGAAPSAPSAAASASGLPGNSAPAPTAGQLVAFSRFSTKDPFAQQVQASCLGPSANSSSSGASACAAASSAPAPAAKAPAASVTTGGLSSSPTSPSTPAKSSFRLPALTSATLSVNGVSEIVRVGASFPQAQPIFQLVSLTATTAKIGIAGGSLEGGAATATLTKGKSLTLMNTADGSRYMLRLLAASR